MVTVVGWQRTAAVEGRRIDWPPFTHSDFPRTGEELSRDADAISPLLLLLSSSAASQRTKRADATNI